MDFHLEGVLPRRCPWIDDSGHRIAFELSSECFFLARSFVDNPATLCPSFHFLHSVKIRSIFLASHSFLSWFELVFYCVLYKPEALGGFTPHHLFQLPAQAITIDVARFSPSMGTPSNRRNPTIFTVRLHPSTHPDISVFIQGTTPFYRPSSSLALFQARPVEDNLAAPFLWMVRAGWCLFWSRELHFSVICLLFFGGP